MKGEQTTQTIDKDNIKDQAQILTDKDQTKVSIQHQPYEHASGREGNTTQTMRTDKYNIKDQNTTYTDNTRQSACMAGAV